MNYIWPCLIIFGFLFSLFTGNIENVNKAIFSSTSDAVTLSLTLIGNMCLWCGVMNIVKNTKIILILKKVLRPVLNWLFPKEKNNEEVIESISINMVSNILGIGNASMPAGLKAMKEMQKNNKNKDKLTSSMSTLVVLNTVSLQLIPTTVLAIRTSMQSQNPSQIIFPIWGCTIVGVVVGIVINRVIIKRKDRGSDLL